MGRPMKAHRSNRSNRPVNRSNRPVNRSEPVARENLNLFEFGFEFNRFPPVTGQTGPVNRNRSPAVTGNRLGNKTLAMHRLMSRTLDPKRHMHAKKRRQILPLQVCYYLTARTYIWVYDICLLCSHSQVEWAVHN